MTPVTNVGQVHPGGGPDGAVAWTTAIRVLVVGTSRSCDESGLTEAFHEAFVHCGFAVRMVLTSGHRSSHAGFAVPINLLPVGEVVPSLRKRLVYESLSPCDLILVEGQGMLTSQSNAGLCVAILSGVAPDAIVLCHDPQRNRHDIDRVIKLHEEIAGLFHHARVVGICLESPGMTDEQSIAEEKRLEIETGLPVVDSGRFGVQPIADAIIEMFMLGGVDRPVSEFMASGCDRPAGV